MSLFTLTAVLRVRGEKIDETRYGEPVFGPSTDTPSPAWWEPRTSSENVSAREQYVSGYWVYLPLGADVGGADVIVLDDVEYDVVGEPGRQPGGFIVEGHLKFAVERTTG